MWKYNRNRRISDRCPKCRSKEVINIEDEYYNDDTYTISIICDACGTEFLIHYIAVSVEIIENVEV